MGRWLRPHLALKLGQLVAHGDEELPVAFALVGREGQDAGEVVALLAALLLAEIPGCVMNGMMKYAVLVGTSSEPCPRKQRSGHDPTDPEY